MSLARKQQKDGERAIVRPAHICEKGRTISVSLTINSVPEEELQIDLEKTQLLISTSKQTMKTLIITIPVGSRIRKKTFHNGILQVILEKP
jgi:HSP20 family molecular chaperone IbpA